MLAMVVCTSWPAFTQRGTEGQPVNLEFRAVDRNGQPMLDLARADLRLRVDGREYPVRALELRRFSGPLAAPFASNLDTGRDVVLVVDEESVLPGSIEPVREALSAVVTRLAANDRIGLLSLHGTGMALAPTDRRAAVERAIGDVRGRAFSRETDDDFSCRTRVALQRLTNLFGTLPRGATTTVIIFSSALAVPAPAPVFVVGGQTCILQPSHFDEFREVAARSAASVYGLRVVDRALPDDAGKAAGLEKIVLSLDGNVERLSTTPADQLRRIVEETAPYYVASFELDAPKEKNARRLIDLTVAREGVNVRVQREAIVATTEAPGRSSPRDMLRVSAAFRALPLRAAAYPSVNPGEKTMKVIVLFEPDGQAALTSAMAALFSEEGRLVTQWVSEAADLARRPVLAGLIAPPGTYRLRVAAVDDSGRSGAVDAEMRAALTEAGPVKLSAMLLSALDGGSMVPRLQFGPGDAGAGVYFEAYGPPRCAGIAATLELSDSPEGPARVTAPASPTPIDQSDGCILVGGFDIGALPPGDYVVRAIVSVDGKPAGRATRTLRKTPR
jgi:hypothetical protein